MHGAMAAARSSPPWARAMWWSVAAAVNGMIVASGAFSPVEASLINLVLAVAARHDAVARGAFVVGRSVRSYLYHAQSYARVLVVATGAGIGPVLPYLVDPAGLECLWIGRDHRAAVGPALVERLLHSGRLTLIDTVRGRPDVGALVAERAARFEAVFVVGYQRVRDQVAQACQGLGVPWYGPTFDS
jgi:hypothetical protein